MRMMNKKLKSRLGRIVRDIERQLPQNNQQLQQVFNLGLVQAKQLMLQQQNSKNKRYSLHAQRLSVSVKAKPIKNMSLVLKPVLLLPTKRVLHLVQ